MEKIKAYNVCNYFEILTYIIWYYCKKNKNLKYSLLTRAHHHPPHHRRCRYCPHLPKSMLFYRLVHVTFKL